MLESNNNAFNGILARKENLKLTKELLSKVLNLNIQELKFENIVKLDNISDYKFDISKFTATVEKNCKIGDINIYAKIIRYDKIKESIFCYWSLIYQEQFKNKSDVEIENITKKVSIEELELEEEHKKSVFLEIKNNNFGILKYGTEIHFLEFKDYIWCFIIGGLICVIAQILIDKTKITSARILVLFVTVGAILRRTWTI